MLSANPGGDGKSIGDTLYFLMREHGRCVLVVDRFSGNPLQSALDRLDTAAAQMRLDDPIFKDDPDSSPLLIELLHKEPCHHPLLAHSVAEATRQLSLLTGPYPMCGWIFADTTLGWLRYVLKQRMDVRLPNGKRIYLRLFDPRVLPRVLQVLSRRTPPKSGRGQSGLWYQLDRQGQLLLHDLASLSSLPDSPCEWHIDASAAAALERIGAINLSARKLAEIGKPLPHQDDPEVDALIELSERLGLREMEDKVAYAWRAYHYRERFSEHPALARLVETALTEETPLKILFDEHLDRDLVGKEYL